MSESSNGSSTEFSAESRSVDPPDERDMIDRSSVDFDPDDGLLSGTAIRGGTNIPGPHEHVDDVTEDEDAR